MDSDTGVTQIPDYFGTVAQLVERLPEEQRVGGSNPFSSTKFL